MALEAKLTANIKDFQNKLKDAVGLTKDFRDSSERNLQKVGDKLTGLGKKLSIGLTGSITAVAGASLALAKSTSETSSRLLDLAEVAGTTTEKLQEYRHVATQAGVDQDTFSDAGERLIRRLRDVGDEGSRVSKTLSSIGVNSKDSSGNLRDAGDIIEDAILSLSGMENSVERSNVGVQLFGRGWKNLVPMLSLGRDEIERLKDEAHELGLVLGEDALQQSNQFGIALNRARSMVSNLGNQIGAKLAPILTDTLLPVLENDIVPALGRAADYVGSLIDGFNSLSIPTKKLVAGLTGFAAAIGPISLALGGLIKILPLIKVGFAALTGPVGLTIAAVAGGATLIIKNWDKVRDYFVSGNGARLFNNITSLFEQIRDAVTYIWNKLGSNIIEIFKGAFDSVITVLDVAVKTISNLLGIITSILKGDFKGALDGLKNLFFDAFKGIIRIVANAQTMIASALSGLFKSIGLESISKRIDDFNKKVSPSLQRFSSETKDTTEKSKEQTEAVKESTNEIINFSEASEKAGKTQAEYRSELNQTLASWGVYSAQLAVINERFDELYSVATKAGASLKELALIEYRRMTESLAQGVNNMTDTLKSAFNIDTDSEGIKIPVSLEMVDVGGSALSGIKGEATRLAEEFNSQLNDVLQMGVQDIVMNFAESIGTALAEGGNIIESIGGALLGSLGGILVSLGKMVTQVGAGILAVEIGLKSLNPFIALAAGAALIAIGSAFKKGTGNLSNSMGSGGGYSGAGAGSAQYSSPYESSNRGALYNNQRQVVDLELKNGNLVGALKWGENRNDRLK